MIAQLYSDDTIGYKDYDDNPFRHEVVVEQEKEESHKDFLARIENEYGIKLQPNQYGFNDLADERILSQDIRTLCEAARHNYGINKLLDDDFLYECSNHVDAFAVTLKATLMKLYKNNGEKIDTAELRRVTRASKKALKNATKYLDSVSNAAYMDDYYGGSFSDKINKHLSEAWAGYNILFEYTSERGSEQVIKDKPMDVLIR